ncbi:MAG TPA: hypothetical protein VE987_02055 [Polyangiaceae bacterium]|nr:hypothetical protein [Polyangiaceae bacterium]
MANQWTVLPHQSIEKLEDNLWRVEGNLPRNPPIRRVMTVAKLRDGRLVVHNAICLDEAGMRELESFGRPAFLIVPGARHRLDAGAYKGRYPGMVVACPPGARKDVEREVKVDTTQPDFGDDSVRWHTLDGVGGGEGVLEVRSGERVTLVFNDAVMNIRPVGGFMGALFGLVGFTGERPKVSGPTKLFLVKDKPALRANLEKLAATPNLSRVIVSHGAPLDADGLKAAASSL